MYLLRKLILAVIGGVFHWIRKGFQTKLEDEFADQHLRRNSITGLIIFVVIAIIFINNSLDKNNSLDNREVKPIVFDIVDDTTLRFIKPNGDTSFINKHK